MMPSQSHQMRFLEARGDKVQNGGALWFCQLDAGHPERPRGRRRPRTRGSLAAVY